MDPYTYARERAQRGLTFLKEEGPKFGLDWRLIRTEEFDVLDAYRCALGQSVDDHFYNALERIHGRVSSTPPRWEFEHGFLTGDGLHNGVDRYAMNKVWTDLLQEELHEEQLRVSMQAQRAARLLRAFAEAALVAV